MQSRSIVYGTVCGTLPSALRTRYVLDGWYTEPQGGERVAADQLFTALSDGTWYAHWLPDPLWLAGDTDGNSSVDLRDVVRMQRFLAGGWNVTVDEHADVNADGLYDLRDVMLLRRFLAGGWNVELI